jgi:hypothetical protein
MGLLMSLLGRRDVWKRICLERMTAPLHLNLLSLGVAVFGSFRARERFDLLLRQQHAFGLLYAADAAKHRRIEEVTVVELGVGNGTGLLNLCALAERVRRNTGVRFRLVGFDTGEGLPPPEDYRDHPELYGKGWFRPDRDQLRAKLPPFASVVYGPLSQTMPEFVRGLTTSAPIGFATLDVDYYSSSKHALGLFTGPASAYLPVVPLYVDDIHLDTHNPSCGEILAINEFNATHPMRVINFFRFLRHARVFKDAEWLDHMYKVDVLDHPERTATDRPMGDVQVANPYLK